MRKFSDSFLKEDESDFFKITEGIDIIHSLLAEKMSKGYSYYGSPEFSTEILREYEFIPHTGIDSNSVMQGIAESYNGQIRWNSTAVLHNINPPASIDATVAACVANICNPNPLWDFVSSGSQEMEKQVVRQMSRLIGWDEKKTDGVFTFGGKGCLTYALKLGLNRAIEGNAYSGLCSDRYKKPVVIASEESHYSLDTVCSLLGIGTENSIRIKTDQHGGVLIDEFANTYNRLIDEEYCIAAIVVNGGNTLNNSIDNLKKMLPIIESRKNDLGYTPYIHFDMVITWAWLFFQQYDDVDNPLNIEPDVLRRIRVLSDLVSFCKYADSVGIDFHKTGFTPYISSLFLAKNGGELHSIFKPRKFTLERKPHGNNFLQHHTIEHSRNSASIYSAWAALQGIGIEGFQFYISNLMTVAATFRKTLSSVEFDCLNDFSMAFAGAFFPHYKGRSYEDVKAMESVEEVNNYVYRLFEYFYKGDHKLVKYVLGFLPQCGTNSLGYPISGLRIFPMSAHISPEKAIKISQQLTELKMKFDERYHYGDKDSIDSKPEHVPK